MKPVRIACATIMLSIAAPAVAQDVSPVLLLESLPSNNPEYRRMVNVKYLSGDRVRVNYTAYNRAEFKQTPNVTPPEAVRACANGSATSLSEIKKFEKAEAGLKRKGQAPQPTTFCIKNVRDWTSKNKDRYLDPIFNGMPYAASLK